MIYILQQQSQNVTHATQFFGMNPEFSTKIKLRAEKIESVELIVTLVVDP